MNINSYIRKYGHLTFKQHPFNEVDALIFAELSYVNLDLYCPKDKLIPLHQIKVIDSQAFYKGSVDSKRNKILFKLMQQSPRFKNVKVGNIKQVFSLEKDKQFFAISFYLDKDTIVISYRGTDTSLLGWKEDMYFTYSNNIPSHTDAINYLNDIASNFNGNIYVVGHSKGGNLAVYAALFMDEKYLNKITKVYSFDGPGVRDLNLLDTNYPIIKDKLEKFLTYFDVVGVVNNSLEQLKIVHSTGVLLGGHDPFGWRVYSNGEEFVYSEKRSKISRNFEAGMRKWSHEFDDNDKELVTSVLMELLGAAKTIYDIPKAAIDLLKDGKERLDKKFTQQEQDRAKEIFKKWLIYITGIKK